MHLVQTAQQAALMLTEGRVSVWLTPEPSYLFLKNQFPQIKIASPVIYRGNLYHYIHISKAHLLEKIETSAKNYMKAKSQHKQD